SAMFPAGVHVGEAAELGIAAASTAPAAEPTSTERIRLDTITALLPPLGRSAPDGRSPDIACLELEQTAVSRTRGHSPHLPWGICGRRMPRARRPGCSGPGV